MGQAVTKENGGREDLRDRVRNTLARLSQTGALPTLASAATAALGLARDPEADVDKLCRIIQSDVGLAARVLRVANSAAVGRRTPARKLHEAVMTLGLRKTCDILVAACARRLYETSSPRTQDLWNHALAVAVAAEELALYTRRVDPGSAFLPGLFHDVGRIAFLIADESSADVIEGLVEAGEGETTELEREWYGFDHAEAGAILVEDWGLALEQCDAIRWHHQPTSAGSASDLAAVLNAADALAYTIGAGTRATAPAGITVDALGLSPEDTATCLDKTRAALTIQQELLG